MFNKDSFIKLMHGSIIERDTFHIQITPQLNSRKSRIIPKLATAIKHLIFKHSTPGAQPGGHFWQLHRLQITEYCAETSNNKDESLNSDHEILAFLF